MVSFPANLKSKPCMLIFRAYQITRVSLALIVPSEMLANNNSQYVFQEHESHDQGSIPYSDDITTIDIIRTRENSATRLRVGGNYKNDYNHIASYKSFFNFYHGPCRLLVGRHLLNVNCQ